MGWQERNFSTVIEQIPVGVAVTLTDGTVEYVNPCLRRWLGLSAVRLPHGGLAQFRPPADAAGGERIRQRLLAGESWQGETRWRTTRGEVRDVLESIHPLHDAAGALTHCIHFLQDISALKRAETLSNLAFYDSLTGLPNRNLFNDRLARALALAQRNGGGFALLLIDIDRFKRVNDTLGHDAGDELLRQVGARLRRTLRKIDTVARLGGDEFAAILENVVDTAVAAKMAEKLLAACGGHYELAGSRRRVSLSVGISLYPQDINIPETQSLLKRADRAMYRAKAAGRNGYFVGKPRA